MPQKLPNIMYNCWHLSPSNITIIAWIIRTLNKVIYITQTFYIKILHISNNIYLITFKSGCIRPAETTSVHICWLLHNVLFSYIFQFCRNHIFLRFYNTNYVHLLTSYKETQKLTFCFSHTVQEFMFSSWQLTYTVKKIVCFCGM